MLRRVTCTNRLRVDIPATERDRPAITQVVYDVPQDAKLDVLRSLLDERGDGSVVIFGRTKHGVRALGRQLTTLGYPVAALQGNLSQNARDRVMDDFRSGRLPILVATNVAARGMDVLSVERVINYELPESADLFTHRIGRTGRMGRSGEAITLLAPDDAPKWRQLERTLGRSLSRRPWIFPNGLRPARPAALAVPANKQSGFTETTDTRMPRSTGDRPLRQAAMGRPASTRDEMPRRQVSHGRPPAYPAPTSTREGSGYGQRQPRPGNQPVANHGEQRDTNRPMRTRTTGSGPARNTPPTAQQGRPAWQGRRDSAPRP